MKKVFLLIFIFPFIFATPDCDELTFTFGDLNNDGVMNILDLIKAVNIVLETIEPTDEQLCAFDFDENGNNDICDIVFGLSPCAAWGPCD